MREISQSRLVNVLTITTWVNIKAFVFSLQAASGQELAAVQAHRVDTGPQVYSPQAGPHSRADPAGSVVSVHSDTNVLLYHSNCMLYCMYKYWLWLV